VALGCRRKYRFVDGLRHIHFEPMIQENTDSGSRYSVEAPVTGAEARTRAAGGGAIVLFAALSVLHPVRAPAQVSAPVLVRQMYGDVAIELRRGEGTAIHLGAADATHSLDLLLLAADVRRWADSATRVLAAHPKAKAPSARWETTLEEPGVRSGSIALSRTITPGDTVIALLIADTDFEQIRTTLDAAEAKAFVAAMKRAAASVSASRPPRPPRKARPLARAEAGSVPPRR
jgi:hypothetical protein